jgi:hypothetical protein
MEEADILLNEISGLIEQNRKSFSSETFNMILEKSIKIVRIIPLSGRSFGPNAKPLTKTYMRFAGLTELIENELSSVLYDRQNTFSSEEAAGLIHLKDYFTLITLYNIEYLKALDNAVNIETLSREFYPKSKGLEYILYAMAQLTTRIYGIMGGIKKSEKNLKIQVDRVCAIGNMLTDSLYDYNAAKASVERYIRPLMNKEHKEYLNIDKPWAMRKAINASTSIWKVLFSLAVTYAAISTGSGAKAIGGIIGPLLNDAGKATGIEPFLLMNVIILVIGIITGIVVSMLINRYFISRGNNNSFYKKIKKQIENHIKDSPEIENIIDSAVSNLQKNTGKSASNEPEETGHEQNWSYVSNNLLGQWTKMLDEINESKIDIS